MVVNNLTKGGHVDSEERGSKHRALRHTKVVWGGLDRKPSKETNSLPSVR